MESYLDGETRSSQCSRAGGLHVPPRKMIDTELTRSLDGGRIVGGDVEVLWGVAYRRGLSWFVFGKPLSSSLFVVGWQTNRRPGDLAEAEQE